jgi:alanine racemase
VKTFQSPLRLRLDGDALLGNWRWLADRSGPAACGAAIKADGYGLGAVEVMKRLLSAGCRDFFVATWGEVAALGRLPVGATVSVLHGVREEDMAAALKSPARPTLCTAAQIGRWKDALGGPCDVMVDTGINRLGISVEDVTNGLLDGLQVETLMSHLACGDDDVPQNAEQRDALVGLGGRTGAKRHSLANSAGICLGADYAFDLTRPGLAIYGGVARPEAVGNIRTVATPEAQILQRRTVVAGQSIGYNATFTAVRDTEVAILNLGYADGYLRSFSNRGSALHGDVVLPVLGRVSMDLTAICVDGASDLAEGDWVAIDYDLPTASTASGLSQYELLTSLGARYDRQWV